MFKKAAVLCLGAAIITIGTILMVSQAPADPPGNPHVPDEVIIKFKDNASNADKDQVRAELGGFKVKGWGRIKAELRKLGSELTVEEAISRYRNHPKVQYIEPNYIVDIVETPNDALFNQLWGMENTGQTGGTPGADISATNAWDVFTGSGTVLIGVIDTGVDYTHPDLAANIYTNPGEIPGNGIDDDLNGFIDDVNGWDFYNDDNDPMDDNGHGSHCSGTIGGVGDNGIGVAGVNWTVKILPIKFLSGGGSGSTADAIDAVDYATLMGVNLTSNSWGGGGFSQALYDAIADANAAGQLFVAAAGNSGANTDVSAHYPSSYDLPNIISVAATDHNDQLASFSNYGAVTVDLAAPGVDILSTFPGNSYGSISGTSMATPHVAGALGLVFGRFPAIGHLDAKNLIYNFVDPLPNLVGLMTTEGRLNAFFPIADPDSIPPGAVTDLAVTGAASNWLQVDWTAPGDDGYSGTASRYIVKVSTSPITAMNFDAAMTVPNPPDPVAAGMLQDMQVPGLDFSTTYYVALKALDEFGNAGDISNVASGTTLGAPDIAWTPGSFTETLLAGASSSQTLTISNVAEGTLVFEIPLPDLVTTPPVQAAFVEYGKGELDPREGEPVIEGTGGPDGFGYRWVDSDEPFGPTFAWTDISGTGTLALASGDDSNVGPFPIGFNFSFYGVEYTSFRVCSNGFLSLSSTSTAYSNQPLPNGSAPFNLIAPFWDDLNLSTSGDIHYETDGTSLIVQWTNVAHYGSGGPYTFQAILSADGTIEFQYLSMGSPDNSATVGIQNATGTDGLQIAYNTNYIHDSLAVRMVKVPQWVTVSPTSGIVYAPGSTVLSVDLNSTGLLGGTYDGNIRIVSNDPDEPTVTIPVELTVIGAPDIDVAPASFDFGPVFLGATPTTEILVQNPGTDVLTVSSITVDDAVYGLDITSFTVPPRSSQTVTVTFSPVLVGMYPATMTVLSDDPDEPSFLVSLAGEGVEPPDFSVDPTALLAALFTGESEVQAVTLTNAGGADLEYNVTVDLGTDVTVYDVPDLAKGEEDLNPGILGSGGPDAFGYSWIDSDDAGGPAFDWVDISGVGTPMFTGNSDDGNLGPFPIGFDFSFYGNTFNSFRACSNGFLSFTSSSGDFSNGPLPGTSAPENLLAVYHDDMYVDVDIPSQVYYHNDGSRLIVQWDSIRRLGQGDASPPFYTFQAILYPNGTILYQYLTVGTVNNSATVGIQNDARDDGLNISYNTAYAYDGLAVRISAAPEWLTAGPLAGIIPPGGSDVINVTFDAADLFGGLYEGGLIIDTNDPLAPQVTVPCDLTVTGAPDIVVDPTAIDFGQVFVGYPDLVGFSIFNAGTDVLTITGIGSTDPAFSVFLGGDTFPINLDPLASTVLQARFSPPSAIPFAGNLTINSNDPDSPAVLLALTGEGLIAPVAGANPTSLSSALFTGETETQTVVLTNTGGSDLTFDLAFDLGANVTVYPDPDLAKGEEDLNPGILGSGGPDLFGYSWVDSDDPGGPTFNWVDISGMGTPIYTGNADDSNRGPFPIGFDFSFYGNTFNTFRTSTNGFVTFTSTLSDFGNAPLPGTGAPENLLAVYHDDMYVDADIPSQVYYYNDGTRLIVQFDNLRRFGQSDASPPFYTFQAILYPNGSIVYQYLTVGTTNNSATVGIQNDARDDGLNIAYNTEYAYDGLAVRIATQPEWLTASPASGVVPPGGSLPIAVTFDASGLFGGAYDGAVLINNNDPANGLIVVDAHLDVTGVPRIGFDPESLDFGDIFIGYPATLPLTVTNIGTDLLSVASVMSGLPDYSVDIPSFDLEPLESIELMVTFDPVADGMRNTDLTFMSNDPDSPHTVPVAGVGVIPPVAEISPTTVVGAAMPGGSKTKTLTLCNTGGSDLIWTAGAAEATATQVYEEVIGPKGQDVPGGEAPADPRPGILGAGGPDTFGYTWIDSDEPGGPAFDWVDISAIGNDTDFPPYDLDGTFGPYPIGFDFPYYEGAFTEFYVCSNGWISFTNGSLQSYSNQPLPNSGSGTPENMLAIWWDDNVYDESDGSYIKYYNDGNRLIIEYFVRRIAQGAPPYLNFEIILYPNGNVVYQYNSLGPIINSATIGWQNAAKDDGQTIVFNDGSYPHTDLAILISSGPQWLSLSPESGVVPAGECVDIDVLMDAAELEAGDYYGDITITSNDPANPSLMADVEFHVGTVDAADCDVDPNTINLGSNGNWITAYIELPMGYDPADVLVETVRLNGVVPADLSKSGMGDWNHNQVPDWTFKFDRTAVQGILPEGDSVPITITGEIEDIIYFTCTDYVRVINPTVNAPNGGETLLAGSAYEIAWTNPQGWEVLSATITYSPDGGQTWNLVAENVTGNSYLWMVPGQATQDARVRVYVLDAVGVMGSDDNDLPFAVTTSVTGVNNVTPTVYALTQNAPNPFRGATHITYDLPEESKVELKIFDVTGRMVRVLENGMLPAGRYEASWDGRDQSGRSLAAGIYFYRLESAKFSATKRMFLLK